MQNKQAFIFFGASGSGKGTQAKLLKEFLLAKDSRKVVHIETGNRFRALKDQDSFLAKRVVDTINDGELLPVFLSVWNWTDAFFKELEDDAHIVLDGSPRRKNELPILESALDYFKYDTVHVISLEVDEDILVDRLLKRDRKDDDAEAIKKRLSWFMSEVEPMIEYYENNPKYCFHRVDGNKSVEEIQKDILSRVGVEIK